MAESEGEIVGFLLAYKTESIKETETLNKLLQVNLIVPFVLIKQIVVAASESGKGVAAKLYRKLYQAVPERGYAAAIVTEPLNKPSIRFHEKRKFQHLCDILPPTDADGVSRNRAIWYRGVAGTESELPAMRMYMPNRCEDMTSLLEKAHIGVAFYNHEDNLNWTKLGMLVTFMMALFAAASYLLNQPANYESLFMSSMLVVFGLYINGLFWLKINSGLMFMQSHKVRLKGVEGKLLALNPNLTAYINISNDLVARKSRTAKLLEHLPLVSMLLWVVCSFLLLHKNSVS